MEEAGQLQVARRLVSEAATVVWDFDGVIADTEPIQARSFAALLSSYGVETPLNFFAEFLGQSEREIWQTLDARYGLRATPEELASERSGLYLGEAAKIREAPYVRPLLAEAASAGSSCVVVSSGSIRHIEYLLQSYGLLRHFSELYCLGSPRRVELSDKEQRLRYVAQALPAPQVILEDSPEYLTLAQDLGMRTIAVRHGMSKIATCQGFDACLQH